ncbi:MAG TPA: AmmeMemoRadiSam system protein B [Ignavibacteriaceae bacterium]
MKIFFTLFFFSYSLLLSQIDLNDNIRPIRDSIGFCWSASEMDLFIDFLSKQNPQFEDDSKNIFAAISVHDDYLYAGNVYYPLYKNIRAKEVVIFGVTHGTVTKQMGPQSNVVILDSFQRWRGPYKEVEISPLREFIKSNLPQEYFTVSNQAHAIEHSIEAVIPFLQYYNRNIKITPIMVTRMPLERMEELSTRLSKIIVDYAKTNRMKLGEDIFFLISNDANHYGEDFKNSVYGLDSTAHFIATENDKKIIQKNLTGLITDIKIYETANDLIADYTNKAVPLWCGRYPIVMGLLTISKIVDGFEDYNFYGKLFKYSDTFTEKVLPVKNTSMGLTAVFSYKHWCGWFTEGFYLTKKN